MLKLFIVAVIFNFKCEAQDNTLASIANTFTRECILKDCPITGEKTNCKAMKSGNTEEFANLLTEYRKCMKTSVCNFQLDPTRVKSLSANEIGEFSIPSTSFICRITTQNASIYGLSQASNSIIFPLLFAPEGSTQYDVTILLENLRLTPFTITCTVKPKNFVQSIIDGIRDFIDSVFNVINDLVPFLKFGHWKRIDSQKVSVAINQTNYATQVGVTIAIDRNNPKNTAIKLNYGISVNGDFKLPGGLDANLENGVRTGVINVTTQSNFWKDFINLYLLFLNALLTVTAETCAN